MAAAKIKPDISIQHMRRIILRTIAVSGLRDAQVRYYAGAGPGGFALSHDECVESTFYVMASRLSFYFRMGNLYDTCVLFTGDQWPSSAGSEQRRERGDQRRAY